MMFSSRLSRWSKALLHYTVVIGASTLVAANVVVAFTEPALLPPQGTTVAPLNTGPTQQDKSGNLRVQGLRSFSVALLATDVGSNVGIGTTNVPSKLTIGSTDAVNEGAEISFLGAGTNRYFYLDNFAGTLRYVSEDTSGESVKLVIGNDGNVGIGTMGPANKLDVAGTIAGQSVTGSGDVLKVGNDTKLVDIDIADTMGIYGLQDNTRGHIKLGSSGPTISGVSGNVGIGTTGPGYKLDVNGAVGLGNSDIYFTNTGHTHTGIGNTQGFAAIENAANYNTLMILGRSGGIGGGRSVSVWDRLDVNGTLCINGVCQTSWPASSSTPNLQQVTDVGNTTNKTIQAQRYIDDDPNFYVDANTVSILNDIRPSIIYDRNNTGYFLDPDNGSQVNTIYANNWFRAQGQSGIYFEDYGGGWHMTDSTWIRSYGSKPVYMNNGYDSGAPSGVGCGGGLGGGYTFQVCGSATVTNGLTVGNAGGAFTYITLRDDESPNGVKYIHANSNVIGFLSGAGSWLSYWDNAGNMTNIGGATFIGNITAPSVQGSSQLCIGGDCRSAWPSAATPNLQQVTSVGNTTNTTIQAQRYIDDDPNFYVDANTVSILNDIRPSIIYDRDNTGYFLDPNSVSRVYNMNVAGGLDVQNAGGAYTYITLRDDESPNGLKNIHANSNVIGFLGGQGNWLSYWDDAGNMQNMGVANFSGFVSMFSDLSVPNNTHGAFYQVSASVNDGGAGIDGNLNCPQGTYMIGFRLWSGVLTLNCSGL